MSTASIGQTVVTDPATSGSGSYYLVAASQGVTSLDREHLAALPQVSDYLHLESSPRVFFSFYRLPSGAWAFTRRSTLGKRRGTLNRIVAHALILPEEVLEELGWELWLLPTCAYHAGGSGERKSFESLNRWEGGSFPHELEDLDLVPPQEGDAKRLEILASRRKYLADRWGAERLEDAVGQALAAFEAGRSLLLPQGPEHEQLLALVWSILPRRDRREIPWTTHLAPGSAGLFRLGNVRSAEEARAAGAAGWSTLGELRAEAGSVVVAKSLVTDRPLWSKFATRWYESLDESGLSLIHKGPQVRRWALWLEHGGAPAQGVLTVRDLKAYLDARSIDSTAVEDSWERPDELLRLAAILVRNLKRNRGGLKTAAGEVLEALKGYDLADVLLRPERLAELCERETEMEADTLLAALELALLHAGADSSRQEKLHFTVLTAAQQRNDLRLAGRIAAEYFVPHGSDSARLPAEEVASVLAALREAPEGLAEALLRWPADLYDRAAAELGRWAKERPQTALQAVAHLASFEDVEIREAPLLPGLSARLAEAGAPAEHWLPFALAEAAVIDRGKERNEARRFASLLRNTEIPPERSRHAASSLCRRLQRFDLIFGAAHRALVSGLAPALAMQPAEVLGAFERIRFMNTDLRDWCTPFAQVADALDLRGRRAEASQVRRIWWAGMASLPWEGVPEEAFALFDALSEADRKEVSEIWIGKLIRLTSQPGEEAIVAKLRERIATDPKQRLDLEILEIRSRIPKVGLTRVVAELAEKLQAEKEGEKTLGNILEEELRGKGTKRKANANANAKMRVLFELLLAPGLLPSTRRLIEERFFESELKKADRRLFGQVPPLEELAQRGSLLLKVSFRLGELSPMAPYDSYQFLKEAARCGRFDAVGAFLRGAESAQSPEFFKDLGSRAGDPELVAQLKKAAQDPVHRWCLAPFLPRINALRGS